MKFRLSLALSLSMAITSPTLAQEADTLTLIHAGQMLDVETGQMKADQYILIEDGVITHVGTEAHINTIPQTKRAEKIDLSDYTVLPGLSDAHVHLTSDANIHGYKQLSISTPRAAITGVRNANRTLMAGFTTVRNVGAPDFTDVALMEAIGDGDIPGPRMLSAGRPIGVTGGHCDNNLLPYKYAAVGGGVADGPWGMRQKVRENKKYGANVIKMCATGGVLSKGTKVGAQQLSLEEMTAIVEEAHMLGLKVAAHAHGAEGINTAIIAGVDSVEHASFITDESIALAKQNGTYLSMDVYVSDYILTEGAKAGVLEESLDKERVVGKKQRERFRAAVEAGAKIAFGSDAGVYPHGDNARQFSLMVTWGMTPLQAIQASTIENARLFGHEDEIGSIAPGKAADIIAVDSDPLKDIQALEDVDFVMKDGVVYRHDLERID